MDRSEVAKKLKTYIKTELLNNPDYALGDDEPLISGGLLNSFALAQIGVFVEEEFDVYIPDDELSVERMDTINQMTDRIIETIGAS